MAVLFRRREHAVRLHDPQPGGGGARRGRGWVSFAHDGHRRRGHLHRRMGRPDPGSDRQPGGPLPLAAERRRGGRPGAMGGRRPRRRRRPGTAPPRPHQEGPDRDRGHPAGARRLGGVQGPSAAERRAGGARPAGARRPRRAGTWEPNMPGRQVGSNIGRRQHHPWQTSPGRTGSWDPNTGQDTCLDPKSGGAEPFGVSQPYSPAVSIQTRRRRRRVRRRSVSRRTVGWSLVAVGAGGRRTQGAGPRRWPDPSRGWPSC